MIYTKNDKTQVICTVVSFKEECPYKEDCMSLGVVEKYYGVGIRGITLNKKLFSAKINI